MLEQIIRRVELETEAGKLTPRFGPLMNDSHRKQHIKDIEKEVESKSLSPDKINLNREEIVELVMNREFPSLRDMNLEGWKLEGFSHLLDDKSLGIQVAIFSRNIQL